MILEVQNRSRQKVAYLEKAFNIKEDLKLNTINYLTFSLPKNDPKNEYLKPLNLIKTPNGLYRIINSLEDEGDVDILNYECEHVIATLIDDIIFGSVVYGNLGIYTDEVISYVLDKQETKNWILGNCDFRRQFEYNWENENLLSALFSIPKPLTDKYIWRFDTDHYPWQISLEKLDTKDTSFFIMPKKNQVRMVTASDHKTIATRLYPLGYGEGVNQLNIKDINGGLPYIQAEDKYIEKYGLIKRVWIDRRYENPESLKAAAEAMLDKLKEPTMEFDVDWVVFENKDEELEIGKKVNVNNKYIDYIVGIEYDYDDITSSKVTLSNTGRDVESTIADLADRQRIEMTYSQGATQLYAQTLHENADSRNGAKLNFYIPSEMRVINKVMAKIRLDSFRAYSKAIKGGGAMSYTTDGGGGTYTTTGWQGGQYVTTSWQGGQYESTSTDAENYQSGRGHNHGIKDGTKFKDIYGYVHSHVESAQHTHRVSVRIDGHDHSVNIGGHEHSVSLRDHYHSVTTKDHTHDIDFGIYESYKNLRSFTIKVNGQTKKTVYSTDEEIDLTEFLLNKKNTIDRGAWHAIEIVPNDLAYVSIDLYFQGFVQSRGDYTV